jgi:hypothetical protein
MLKFKSSLEVKNCWAVINGWKNWFEFTDSLRRINNQPPDSTVYIPETIVDELLEMML